MEIICFRVQLKKPSSKLYTGISRLKSLSKQTENNIVIDSLRFYFSAFQLIVDKLLDLLLKAAETRIQYYDVLVILYIKIRLTLVLALIFSALTRK